MKKYYWKSAMMRGEVDAVNMVSAVQLATTAYLNSCNHIHDGIFHIEILVKDKPFTD